VSFSQPPVLKLRPGQPHARPSCLTLAPAPLLRPDPCRTWWCPPTSHRATTPPRRC
jgi:hypothetical protein